MKHINYWDHIVRGRKMNTCRNQAGFTLIELLVAMVIGLLIMAAALSSASFYEANRRNTTGNNSALENAMVSAMHIQKDARMAGLGLTGANGEATCSSINVYYKGTKTDALSYSSVLITRASGAANTVSDSITFTFSDPIGTIPVSSPIDGTPPAASSEAPVTSTNGFADNQVGMLVPPLGYTNTVPCTVVGITAVQTASSKVQYNPAGSPTTCTGGSCWNPENAGPFTTVTGICNDGTTNCNSNSKTIPAGSRLMTTGPLQQNTYSVTANGEFQKVETFGGAATSIIAENVVLLRAQYGLSNAANSSVITKWVNGNSTDAANLPANRKAIRIVAVARSAQRLKDKDASGACTATTSAPATGFQFTNNDADKTITLDLSANSDWKCYTYKTISMTIPLKNIVMQTSSPGG